MEKHLFKELDKNLLCIKEFFGNSADYFEKEILILEGSGHAVNYHFAPEICREKIKAFVEKYE